MVVASDANRCSLAAFGPQLRLRGQGPRTAMPGSVVHAS